MPIGEACNIRWEDLDLENKTIVVRDRKAPAKRPATICLFPCLVTHSRSHSSSPRKNELIFPSNPRSVTAGFQRVRNELGIEDLRYHDLRREGASRLFVKVKGYSIEGVAQVTGHRSLDVLWQGYTQLNPINLQIR